MKPHKPSSFKKLATKDVEVEIIGGQTDYCEDRYGFRPTDGGYESAHALGMYNALDELASPVKCLSFNEYGYSIYVDKQGAISMLEHKARKIFALGNLDTPYAYAVTYNDGERRVCCIGGGNTLYKFSEAGVGVGKNPYTVPYKLKDAVWHRGRFFATDADDGYILRWSGREITDWERGTERSGWVKLSAAGGRIVGLASLGEKIIIVREEGITPMCALGDACNFRLEPTRRCGFSSPVLAGSVVAVDGKVWFCTENSLCYYGGASIVNVTLEKYLQGYIFSAMTASDNRYLYINCTYKGDKYIIEYDTVSGASVVFGRGCDLCWKTPTHFFAYYQGFWAYFTEDRPETRRFWRSRPVKLANDSPKMLKSIETEKDDGLKVYVSAGGVRKEIAQGGLQRVELSGDEFVFELWGVGKCNSLKAVWEVRK